MLFWIRIKLSMSTNKLHIANLPFLSQENHLNWKEDDEDKYQLHTSGNWTSGLSCDWLLLLNDSVLKSVSNLTHVHLLRFSWQIHFVIMKNTFRYVEKYILLLRKAASDLVFKWLSRLSCPEKASAAKHEFICWGEAQPVELHLNKYNFVFGQIHLSI